MMIEELIDRELEEINFDPLYLAYYGFRTEDWRVREAAPEDVPISQFQNCPSDLPVAFDFS